MRADNGAVVALGALVHVHLGHLRCLGLLLDVAEAHGAHAARRERGHRDVIALEHDHRLLDLHVEGVVVALVLQGLRQGRGLQGEPLLPRVLDGHQAGHGVLDGAQVALDHGVPVLLVRLLDGVLEVAHGLVNGQHVGEVEERGLHHIVRELAEAAVLGDAAGVDGVELDVLLGDRPPHVHRQIRVQLVDGRPGAVEHESARLWLDEAEHVERVDVAGEGARQVVRGVWQRQVGGLHARGPEPHVGHGGRAGLHRRVREVRLGLEAAVVTDDLHGVFVGADRAVASQAVEDALGGALGDAGVQLAALTDGEVGVGHVVLDAHGEAILLHPDGILEDRLRHGGSVLLGAEAVAAAQQRDAGEAGVGGERGRDVEEQRLAVRPVLLRPVEHGHRLHAGGDQLQQRLRRPGPEEQRADDPHLVARGVELGQHGLRDPHGAAHLDDQVLGLRVALVADQGQGAPRELADLVHALLDDAWQPVVVEVRPLQRLHVDVGVLVAAAHDGRQGREAARAVLPQVLGVHQRAHVLHAERLDGVDLVRSAEAVLEVHNRHPALERCDVGHQCEILAVLHALARQHAPAGGARCHHVLVVSEDGQRLARQGARSHVDHAGHELARDLVHVRDHQQQPLRGGERGAQAAGGHGAVEGAGGAGLRLELLDVEAAAPDVLDPGHRPGLADLGHGRRGGDREDEGVL
mmetsp:Transcript_85717/g.242756  ORF Transcript_85717/g.242756 Transcript_85717/m.242756 type:complete len:692 (+) Transcript_85717:838-2913(+)